MTDEATSGRTRSSGSISGSSVPPCTGASVKMWPPVHSRVRVIELKDQRRQVGSATSRSPGSATASTGGEVSSATGFQRTNGVSIAQDAISIDPPLRVASTLSASAASASVSDAPWNDGGTGVTPPRGPIVRSGWVACGTPAASRSNSTAASADLSLLRTGAHHTTVRCCARVRPTYSRRNSSPRLATAA